jgi:hypothetical protein
MNFVSNLVVYKLSKFCEKIVQIALTMKEINKSLKLNGGKLFRAANIWSYGGN